MKIIKIDYSNPDSDVIKKVAQTIDKGKIAIVPGDAVYTIIGDAFKIEAIRKIHKIKKRDRKKPFNLGIYCLEDIAKYGQSNPLIKRIAHRFPEEPFTFVVPRKGSAPRFLNPNYKTLGFRIPFNKVTSTLSRLHRRPVIGTSANISELKNTHSVGELMEYFSKVLGNEVKPSLVLDAGKLPPRRPSTVIEVIEDKVNIIREGEIYSSILEKEIEKIIEDYKKRISRKL